MPKLEATNWASVVANNYNYKPNDVVLESSAAIKLVVSDLVQRFILEQHHSNASKETLERLSAAWNFANEGNDLPKAHADTIQFHAIHTTPTPMLFLGAPGHGKTTAFTQGAKKFCELMDMKFHMDPHHSEPVNLETDFVMHTIELAGVTNATEFGQFPARVEAPHGSGNASLELVHEKIKSACEALRMPINLARGESSSALHSELSSSATATTLRLRFDTSAWGLNENVRNAFQSFVEDHAIDVLRESSQPVISVMGKSKLERLRALEDGITFHSERKGPVLAIEIEQAPQMRNHNRSSIEMLSTNRLVQLSQAKFGALILDDISTATEPIRNIVMRLAREQRIPGSLSFSKGVLVGLTANIGQADGSTNVQSSLSTTEATRVYVAAVVTPPEVLRKDVLQKHKEVVALLERYPNLTNDQATMFMDSFLERYGHKICEPRVYSHAPIRDAQVANPRSFMIAADGLLSQLQSNLVNKFGDQADVSVVNFNETIENILYASSSEPKLDGSMTKEVANLYRQHVQKMATFAMPVAHEIQSIIERHLEMREQVAKGLESEANLATKAPLGLPTSYVECMKVGAHSSQGESFQFDLMAALIEITARKLYVAEATEEGLGKAARASLVALGLLQSPTPLDILGNSTDGIASDQINHAATKIGHILRDKVEEHGLGVLKNDQVLISPRTEDILLDAMGLALVTRKSEEDKEAVLDAQVDVLVNYGSNMQTARQKVKELGIGLGVIEPEKIEIPSKRKIPLSKPSPLES